MATAMALNLGLLALAGEARSATPAALSHELMAYEGSPTAASLDALVPNAPDALVAAARDPELAAYARARAATLLTAFADERGRAALTALAQDGEPEIRALAAYGYARIFGHSDGAAALALAEPLLAHSSAEARKKAALALGWVGGAAATRARTLAQTMATGDPDEWVRVAAQKALSKLPAFPELPQPGGKPQ